MPETDTHLRLPPERWLTWTHDGQEKRLQLAPVGVVIGTRRGLKTHPFWTVTNNDQHETLPVIIWAWRREVKRLEDERNEHFELWLKYRADGNREKETKAKESFSVAMDSTREEMYDAQAQLEGWEAQLKTLEPKGER